MVWLCIEGHVAEIKLCHFLQVAQTTALTDREQEDIRILDLENAIQRVQHSCNTNKMLEWLVTQIVKVHFSKSDVDL